MGNRPAELDRALRSLLAQEGVDLEVLVVGNGWTPVGLPDGVRSIALPSNVGVPEGRNIGAAEVTGDVLLFFDDDLELRDRDVVARAVEEFDRDARLAVLQPRAVAPDGSSSG
ncbi:MAG: glycosyltransferase, partial [Frankiales bacterium]|nr:glycosyltransferase [Frankiales bacterium]